MRRFMHRGCGLMVRGRPSWWSAMHRVTLGATRATHHGAHVDAHPTASVMTHLRTLVRTELNHLYPDLPTDVLEQSCAVKVSPRKDCDYQLPGSFVLAKHLRQNAASVANTVAEALQPTDVPPPSSPSAAIASIDVAKNGLLGVRLSPTWMAQRLVRPELHLEAPQHTPRQHVIVDYASPNMSKELHVGHLRSAIIGDAICRVLEHCGHRVTRLSHVGDFGTPLANVVTHAMEVEDAFVVDASVQPTAQHLGQLYVAAKQRADRDPEFRARAAAVLYRYQRGTDPELQRVWDRLCAGSRAGFTAIYSLLQLHAGLQERGESWYRDRLPGVVRQLVRQGVAEKARGAIVAFAPDQETPLMVEKSDGTWLYGTTDLAAIQQRIVEEKADRIIYVTDDSQGGHFDLLFQVAQKAGWYDPSKVRIEHCPFGVIQGKDGKKLSSREGVDVSLLDVLQQAVHRATDVMKELGQSRDATDASFDQDCASVGIGAIKYFDLCHQRESAYRFSWEHMLALKGNTAVYLMYAYVRVNSVLKKLSHSGSSAAFGAEDTEALLRAWPQEGAVEAHEQYLMAALVQFPDRLIAFQEHLQPNLLCDHLYEVATRFHSFYAHCPILGNERQSARLFLCHVTAHMLKTGLSLLGVQVPSKL